MKDKYTFATYFKEHWWPIIKELLEMVFFALFVIAMATLVFKVLGYFAEHNIIIFYSIMTLIIIFTIIYIIYDDYNIRRKEYYEHYEERKQYYEYCKKLLQEEDNNEK